MMDIINEILRNEYKIYLYGLGVYGIKTYLLLRDKNINVENFVDKSSDKIGKTFDEINCISYSQLLKKNNYKGLLIVCNKNPDNIMKSLQKCGFANVYSCFEIINNLKILPVDINFSDSNVIAEISKFRDLVYTASRNMEYFSAIEIFDEFFAKSEKNNG